MLQIEVLLQNDVELKRNSRHIFEMFGILICLLIMASNDEILMIINSVPGCIGGLIFFLRIFYINFWCKFLSSICESLFIIFVGSHHFSSHALITFTNTLTEGREHFVLLCIRMFWRVLLICQTFIRLTL